MEITVLGCGSSLGCPVIACKCKICLSESSYNKRTRSSIIINKNNKTILVDFGPDIKNQLINNNIQHLDGVICTHAHFDHIAGLDDLKVFSYKSKMPLNLYTDERTAKILNKLYYYIFQKNGEYGPFLKINIIEYKTYNIEDIDISFFDQEHGKNRSMGIRVDDFVYSNDVTNFPQNSEKYLSNIKYWLLDCIDYKKTSAHSGLEEVIFWNKKYKPKFIYLTNLSHNIEYHKFSIILPANIKASFDGLKIPL